jgi:hypothetical protein
MWKKKTALIQEACREAVSTGRNQVSFENALTHKLKKTCKEMGDFVKNKTVVLECLVEELE